MNHLFTLDLFKSMLFEICRHWAEIEQQKCPISTYEGHNEKDIKYPRKIVNRGNWSFVFFPFFPCIHKFFFSKLLLKNKTKNQSPETSELPWEPKKLSSDVGPPQLMDYKVIKKSTRFLAVFKKHLYQI